MSVIELERVKPETAACSRHEREQRYQRGKFTRRVCGNQLTVCQFQLGQRSEVGREGGEREGGVETERDLSSGICPIGEREGGPRKMQVLVLM